MWSFIGLIILTWIRDQYYKRYVKYEVKQATQRLIQLKPELALLQDAIEEQRRAVETYLDPKHKLAAISLIAQLELRERALSELIRLSQQVLDVANK